jgi:hypothetical protein
MSKLTKKVSTTIVSIATVVSLSGAGALLPMTAYGITVEELTAQINSLLATIASLQAQLAAMTGAPAAGTVPAILLSSGDLTLGSKGAAVKALQQFLNGAGYKIAASGAGSPGNETEYFGSLTKAALAKFQAANGISPATGYFGAITRAKLSSLSVVAPAAAVSEAAPAAVVAAGAGLSVAASASQPAATLAPGDASRIPFTRVILTAGTSDVIVNYLTVKRVGLAADASLASVVLLEEDGGQIGLKKTLNSDHTANIGEAMTIKAGTSKTVVVAANRAAAGGSYAGQTVALDVIGVGTSAALTAAFPIIGTTHTINETLTIGSVTMARGPLDPGASQTKEIGTEGYTFSSVKVTAGSAEKMYLKSIRWNQTGSAGSGDLVNVKTYVDGVAYDTTISSDGKYYTTTFPASGILIDKGFNKEVAVKGNITGGSARTIDFDIAKRTDLYLVGETYGYGTIPPQTGGSSACSSADSAAFCSSEDPWYDAAQVTVSSGTITISSWTAVSAQNIAENLADQPLGGWTVTVKGEPISVASMKFTVTADNSTAGSASSGNLDDIDNIKLVDESGKTLAGPLDAADTGTTGTITFTDTVTFPVGVTNIKMVGKLGTDFANNDTVAASTTPSSQWTSITGQSTGVTITAAPTSAVSGQTMTVKAGALVISVSSVPISQTVIAGTKNFEFARYILDTASSGEDVRLTSFPPEYNVGTGGSATDLTNCFLYDDGTALTTSNSTGANPTAAASSTNTFTFTGTGLTLTKGTSKTLSLKCDIKAGAAGRYSWGYDSSADPDPTGLTSGQSITETENDSAGQTMIATASGSLSVALDSSSPSYAIVAAGQEATLAKIKFTATNEDIDLKQVALQLTDIASNTREDLIGNKVTLWDGATYVGEAVFSYSDFATSSAIQAGVFRVPKDSSKILTVKGTIAGISVSGPLTRSGDLLKVDYDGDNEGLDGNYGTGVGSGITITPAAGDTGSSGVRIMKSFPTISKIDLASTKLINGDIGLLRFKISANSSNDVGLYKFTVRLATTSVVAASLNAYAYTDSGFSTPVSGVNSGGKLMNTDLNLSTNWASSDSDLNIIPDSAGTAVVLQIPKDETRYFEVRATITGADASGDSLSTQLQGDAAYPSLSGWMGSAATIDADTNDDFIWSPNSTTTVGITGYDFTNGYSIVALPSSNITPQVLSY